MVNGIDSITSKSKLREINEHSMLGWNHWRKEASGLSSSLEKYINCTIHLRIKNTEKKFSSDYKTAFKFARYWANFVDELNGTKSFVVSFYKNEHSPSKVYSMTDPTFY